ncbi:thiamine ABC transporter ATP-binding protein [Rhodovulum sulfidophilum]|uniref:ATP-binding cassette domain-containing protein n=1 Tax=Rhodovulum visakhapatnamense TaxID=364297 RepID=A0ABS1RFR5_9RHOB|nr:ATP-binding cassette domain-containing protein [Rhodovulum visakhapatnamense]MBL3569879.1 ATP-binding cassette domain-containing protein [Rhodovulum visakhapatnamense]MBL3578428.1 ATP-binding cassette domain-containing protein [Rhodovulum visakhapatnamense]OLS46528.1 thiamine ABC transporter ATP-binding protein [Rhodovulum sulfidophilum]
MLSLERLAILQGGFSLTADLTVAPGQIVALLGPSGAGKSTILDTIAGFLAPDRGRVLWKDTDLGPLAPGDRPLSVLFQDNNLFPHLTAAQNVGLGLRPGLRLDRDQTRAVETALDRVGLAGLGPRKPAALSGGQRGRVALARMLLRNRPLMLLDEPFAALGPALKAGMLDLVAELARETGATVLFVTHDPADARAIADQTILVAEGRAHAPRATAKLLADPPPALRAYLG